MKFLAKLPGGLFFLLKSVKKTREGTGRRLRETLCLKGSYLQSTNNGKGEVGLVRKKNNGIPH